MKKIIYFLVIVIGLGWLIAAHKDKIAKSAVIKAVSAATGLRLEVDSLNIGIIKTDLVIQGLHLFNPEGYKEPEMLYIPHIFVDYNFADLIKKVIHIENMELDLAELFVIKSKDGGLNLSALRPLKEAKSQLSPAEEKTASSPLRIDNLLLKIGKVTYKDYSKNADNPSIQEFKVNFSGRYSNITDLKALVKLLVGRALVDSTLGSMINLSLGESAAAVKAATAESAKEIFEGLKK
ncbi:MAG: AsmA family protein [Candidatus Omnitrophica bacterium]|nr:AsmA family protein [Candidatus Omnitrophota bacterium]